MENKTPKRHSEINWPLVVLKWQQGISPLLSIETIVVLIGAKLIQFRIALVHMTFIGKAL